MKLEDLDDRLGTALAPTFQRARPFPWLALDLDEDLAIDRATEEIAGLHEGLWRSDEHANSVGKLWIENVPHRALSELFAGFANLRDFLATLTGIALEPDCDRQGAGIHRVLPWGYLDMHRDFSTLYFESTKSRWARKVNVLFFLNRRWSPGDGGETYLTNPSGGEVVRVSPLAGRLLIFRSDASGLHGHPVRTRSARYALATYFYADEPVEETPTIWYPAVSATLRSIFAEGSNG